MKIVVRRPKLQRIVTATRVAPKLTRTKAVAVRTAAPLARRMPRHVAVPAAPLETSPGFSPDPHLDYGRILTPQGGIAIVYKDLDLRLRHKLLRLFLWSMATLYETWIVLGSVPVRPAWPEIAALVAVAIVNWLIVSKPVETYRSIEIRPDCMIIEGEDIFWLAKMEGGWPSFCADPEGNQVLCGVYGTRFIEYLTVRKFDELDRTPEVLAAHLQEAMQQLWTWTH